MTITATLVWQALALFAPLLVIFAVEVWKRFRARAKRTPPEKEDD